MFNRQTLLILLAALAAGLGLWAAQIAFAPSLPRDDGPALDPATLSAVRLFPQPRPLPPFELQQSDGTPLTGSELAGRWTLVFLGFTHCPDVCPTTLTELAGAQRAWMGIPEPRRPRVLFVSVDPDRDSPERAGEYARYFHPDTLAATAQEPALQQFATALGLVYMKVPLEGGDYSMDHSTAVVVLDPRGRQAGLIRPPLVPADIAADLRLLAETIP
ncbi:SCO family protein [Arenimonas fontis]|uniref:SCO family protein n=1 Tax=Arenimonas fontis TaxID=2608255 RepID=A0A5B2ZGR3_9GAMM|nr:SCO family protein [Arenimonas fontis]KAA2286212.1 SCO family protein [Arenimonas fontis]